MSVSIIHPRQANLISDPISTEQMTAQIVACNAHQIHLIVPLQAGCQSCQGKCGVAWLTRLWPRRSEPLQIARDQVPFPVEVGDQVILTVQRSVLDRAVWHLYGWPLIGLLFGAVIGVALGDEPLSIVLGLLGLGTGLLYATTSHDKTRTAFSCLVQSSEIQDKFHNQQMEK